MFYVKTNRSIVGDGFPVPAVKVKELQGLRRIRKVAQYVPFRPQFLKNENDPRRDGKPVPYEEIGVGTKIVHASNLLIEGCSNGTLSFPEIAYIGKNK